MARTRSIKPSFFSNDILAELPAETRLLFIGLWTIADRDGRLEDRVKRIKAELFPYDNFDINLMLSQLHNAGFIVRYCVDGLSYLQIVNFSKHQNPHPKEQSNNYPEPAEICEAVKINGNAEKINDEKCLLPITYYPLPITSNPINDAANNHGNEKTKRVLKNKNGTRFETWMAEVRVKDPEVSMTACPDILCDEAVKIGFTEQFALTQWPLYHDYWTARAGANGVKRDWLATWRNWLRNSKTKFGGKNG